MSSMLAGLSAFSSMLSLAVVVMMIIGLWKVFVKAGKPGWHAIIPFLNIYDIFDISCTKKMGVTTIVFSAGGAFIMFIGMILAGTSALGFGTGFYLYGGPANFFESQPYGELGAMGVIGVLIMAIGGIVVFVGAIFMLIAYVKLGRAFGKSGGFLVGLFFIPVVFICILGFGEAQYIGTEYRAATGPYNPNAGYGGYQGQGGYQNPGGYGNQGGYQNPGGYQGTGYSNNTGFQDVDPSASSNNGSTATGMKFCANCGQRLSEVNKFCPSCGKPVE